MMKKKTEAPEDQAPVPEHAWRAAHHDDGKTKDQPQHPHPLDATGRMLGVPSPGAEIGC
ncbi:MAG TPA: hypothetical protein VMC43_03760 [Candidatus Paceibacterota bacterium]|nr:hypothetical protein [Candidatus Paceibacterota bacterium]